MNDLEIRRYNMLKRVHHFGVENANDFPAETLGGKHFTTIREIVDRLTEIDREKSQGSNTKQGGSSDKAVMREALREDLQAIRRVVKILALDDPSLNDKFRLPINRGDQHLLNAARTFAAEAVLIKARLIEYRLPEDFIEDLHADIEALEESTKQQNLGVERQIAANAEIDELIDRGVEAVQRLNPFVLNTYRADQGKSAAWLAASHTERGSRASKKPADSTVIKPEPA